MKFLKWLLSQFSYNERRRKIDLAVLWPSCKQYAPDLATAKGAFSIHAFNDKAWKPLGGAEIKRRIDALQ